MPASRFRIPAALLTMLLVAPFASPFVGADAAGDVDNDGLPDELEVAVCGPPLTRDAINAAGGAAGACVGGNYVPRPSRVILAVALSVVPGFDDDQDDFPSTVTLQGNYLVIDPFTPERFWIEPGPVETHPVDADDNDPDVPLVSVIDREVPVPVVTAFGFDEDRDDVPSSVTVRTLKVTFDRRLVISPFVGLGPSQAWPVDEDDHDKNVPAPAETPMYDFPLPGDATHTGDADGDLLPGRVTMSWLSVKVDRTVKPNPVLTSVAQKTTTLDGDDADADNVVPWSVVDADTDRLPDLLEQAFCRTLQNPLTDDDGACVRADGSGSDGDGENYVAPIGAPNPWNL